MPADVITSICMAYNDKLVLCNCLGVIGTCLDVGLASLLDSLRLDQLVESPTCNENILNILATDAADLLSDVT